MDERVAPGGASPLAPQAPLTWRVPLAPSTSGETRRQPREPKCSSRTQASVVKRRPGADVRLGTGRSTHGRQKRADRRPAP